MSARSRRGVARPGRLGLGIAAAVAAGLVAPAGAGALTYSVESRGQVTSDLDTFAAVAASTLADGRGWSLGGSLTFRRVAAVGSFTLVLASPEAVAAAHPVCSAEWSCRVGDQVLVNDERWSTGTASWTRSLADYRRYVINHEVGHRLGLRHRSCPGAGEPAPVMQQQSISLGACTANVWPLPSERMRVASIWDVELGRPWPVPIPDWFWVWARWYLGHGEFADEPFRSSATRPAAAPLPIPDWAWRRLDALAEETRDRPWPVPLPDWFWVWARWYLDRGEFAEEPFRSRATRPDAAPLPIPDWAWVRLQVLVGDRELE